MADKQKGLFFAQLKATLKRNILLKVRNKMNTAVVIIFSLYLLFSIIQVKLQMPDLELPEITEPRGEENIYKFSKTYGLGPVAFAPNTTGVKNFLDKLDLYWKKISNQQSGIKWQPYETDDNIIKAYNKNPKSFRIAVIFNSENPLDESFLIYNIRTNPSFILTPPIFSFYSRSDSCRGKKNKISKLEKSETCPVNSYYFSGFLTLQMLIDYTKMQHNLKNGVLVNPNIQLEIMPKHRAKSYGLLVFKLIIPFLMIVAISQFMPFLMVLIVSEKEKKIKEGMKIMGLKDSVFWLSWFIIYSGVVLILSIASILMFHYLEAFTCTNLLIIFLIIFLYGLSLITFTFMVTPFLNKSSIAGCVGNVLAYGIGIFYYVRFFIADKGTKFLLLLSLISPAGFGLVIEKAFILDMTGKGVSMDNLWEGPDLSIGASILILFCDILLYGIITYYLDNVIPTKYGVRRSIIFCLLPSFWYSKSTMNNLPNRSQEQNSNIETIPANMIGKEAIEIVDLEKTFKKFFKPNVTAVNGINLTIYEGQITAIIGHNGAGKTTLFNILTGLTAPTNGSVYIFGYDISNSNDMDKIRKMMGVCPQHDILFDELTPEEHLKFFAAIKGVRNINEAVSRTLNDIDLIEKADTISKNLSGGQKRKLSIGIAIIGDPKILILDEPTAGIDPYSRRHMWNVLQNNKKGRVVLLTTHFMDEADILADWKAVVSKGKIRCCGSSLFLKNKFGVGYHLTLVLEDNNVSGEVINKTITSHVPKAELARSHGKEMSFILPYNSVQNFSALFSTIEKDQKRLGISSYGVSMTTLEEVFLQLQKDDEIEVTNLTRTMISTRASRRNLNNSPIEDQGNQQSQLNLRRLEYIQCTPNACQTFIAILKLRFLSYKRDIGKLFLALCFPVILAFITLSNYLKPSAPDIPQLPPISLNIKMYNTPITVNPATTPLAFRTQLELFGAEVDTDFSGNFSSLLDLNPHIGALNVNWINNYEPKISVIYNDTLQHSLPLLINVINNAIAQIINSSTAINVMTQAIVQKIDSTSNYASNFDLDTASLAAIFLMCPYVLASEMVSERKIKIRNQLRVNGLSLTLYLISFFIIQVVIMVIILTSLIVFIIYYKTDAFVSTPSLETLAILFALYCPVSFLFFTFLNYLFNKPETAATIMLTICLLLGWVPYLSLTLSGDTVRRILHIIFSFSDVLYIPYGIFYYMKIASLKCDANPICSNDDYSTYRNYEITIIFIALLVHIPLWCVLVVIADIKKNGGKIINIFKIKKSLNYITEDTRETDDIGNHEDADVKTERAKVVAIMRGNLDHTPVIAVENLHKEYLKGKQTKKIAVKSISLAVDAGEVFGLLGHNGAGKTTTMRIITAEEAPTRGRVQIAGHNITSSLDKAFFLLGYCPQDDPQWKNITVREHLELYATIRGAPRKKIREIIDLYLEGLKIEEHANKQSEQCSGGTRRKLSYAMAMIGNPKIVLMDEPSTGMDPESKRFMWNTVLDSFRGSRGAILTTHSMEEADALCSRVGIMVKGELRCIGSTQHLKNLYGAGYNLEIKLLSENDSNEKLENCKKFVFDLFSSAVLEEIFSDRLIFSIPQRSVTSLSKVFDSLEKVKSRLQIEEYSFSQTTGKWSKFSSSLRLKVKMKINTIFFDFLFIFLNIIISNSYN